MEEIKQEQKHIGVMEISLYIRELCKLGKEKRFLNPPKNPFEIEISFQVESGTLDLEKVVHVRVHVCSPLHTHVNMPIYEQNIQK